MLIYQLSDISKINFEHFLNIMTNSAKTPSGKTSKGKVSIYVDKGRIKARLARQYFGGEQPRIALRMEANEENMARAQRIASRITLDLQDGCCDETLAKYGIVADLKLKGNPVTSDDQLPPKPQLSLHSVNLAWWAKSPLQKQPSASCLVGERSRTTAPCPWLFFNC